MRRQNVPCGPRRLCLRSLPAFNMFSPSFLSETGKHWAGIAMGGQTASGIPSRSVHGIPQYGFAVLFLLGIFVNACDCRPSDVGSQRTSRQHNIIVFQINREQWKNDEEQGSRCPPTVAGSGVHKQVEGGVQLALGHIHRSCSPLRPANFSRAGAVIESLDRDRSRAAALRSRIAGNISAVIDAEAADLPLESGRKLQTGNYIVTAGFGTPAKKLLLTIDTGSDITWIQCQPCADCYSQKDPIFNPTQSSSYKRIGCLSSECGELVDATGYPLSCSLLGGCLYGVRYGDGSESDGDFSRETLTLGSDSFADFAFGCGHTNTGLFKGSAGLLGLGRTPLSLPAQTAAKYQGLFSYCLPDFNSPNAVGSLSFGPSAIPSSGVFTKLLTNPSARSFYFVGLSGISVGGQRLSIPPRVFEPTQGGGGTIIDSGTVITRLTDAAYGALKAAFLAKTSGLPKAPSFSILDTCYDLSSYNQVSIPTVTLHFEDGPKVDVNGVGILVPVSSDASRVCLAFAPSSGELNIIGNFQQQRFRISYDTLNGKVGFSSESCTA